MLSLLAPQESDYLAGTPKSNNFLEPVPREKLLNATYTWAAMEEHKNPNQRLPKQRLSLPSVSTFLREERHIWPSFVILHGFSVPHLSD